MAVRRKFSMLSMFANQVSFIFLLLLLVTGCASGQTEVRAKGKAMVPIDETKLGTVRDPSHIYAFYSEPPPFLMWKKEDESVARNALYIFGPIGGGIKGSMDVSDARAAGDEMRKLVDFNDPILSVKNNFLASWKQQLGLKNLHEFQEPMNSDNKEIRSKLGDGLAIEFETTNWSLRYLSKDVTRYTLTYRGYATLIDMKDGTTFMDGSLFV